MALSFILKIRIVQSITRVLGRASPPFCPAVERVLLNGCGRLTDRGLQTLSRRCPELRHVEMRGCTQVSDVGVLELVSKCAHLSHLDVSGNFSFDSNPVWKSESWQLVTIDGVVGLFTGCSQITCIETGPRSSSDHQYSSDSNSCQSQPQLFLQLQYLDLTDCVGLGDAGVQMIVRSCAQLNCLYLRRCVHVTGTSPRNQADIFARFHVDR